MRKIAELESNASQDGSYREHLNRNWQNINTAFTDIYRRLELFATKDDLIGLGDRVQSLQQNIDNLQQQHGIDVSALQGALSNQWTQVQKNASDINNLGVDLQNHLDQDKKDKDGIDARLKKLEDAVFGLNPVEIDNPPVPDYPSGGLVGINSDDRTRKDKNRW
ncbi:hypothetical protein [Lactobacillus intestinalis]|uniref:hypothetical protein n=1 Tax=Lactobacillus intestinalis TaxID=151781 RepID=UPI00272DB3D4|nr:hypothetical protein [Lactobacillus intestinalis]